MRKTRSAVRENLLGLARGGVYHASDVTIRAVRSYRTFSPFPVTSELVHRGFAFCGTFPRPQPTSR